MRKTKKVPLKDTPTELRRLGVILESVDQKIDTVVEGHVALDQKINRNHGEFQEFRNAVNFKFNVVLDELHLIRNQQVKREEFILLEKRVLELEKRRK